MDPVGGDLERLVYDLGLRTLSQQEGVLEELRARSGVLLAATAFVASFLGGRALSDGQHQWLAIAGVAFAVASILLAVYVLAPKTRLEFSLDAAAVYEHFVREGADLATVHRTLAYWLHDAWETNQTTVDRLVVCFGLACGALVVAVVVWALALGLD